MPHRLICFLLVASDFLLTDPVILLQSDFFVVLLFVRAPALLPVILAEYSDFLSVTLLVMDLSRFLLSLWSSEHSTQVEGVELPSVCGSQELLALLLQEQQINVPFWRKIVDIEYLSHNTNYSVVLPD